MCVFNLVDLRRETARSLLIIQCPPKKPKVCGITVAKVNFSLRALVSFEFFSCHQVLVAYIAKKMLTAAGRVRYAWRTIHKFKIGVFDEETLHKYLLSR